MSESVDLMQSLVPVVTPETIRAEFNNNLAELNLTVSQLTMKLRDAGDFRSQDSIRRAIQRVLAEETNVSAELFVIVNMLLKKQRRYQLANKQIEWSANQNGGICTLVRGFNISLYVNNNGLWQIHVVSKETGYSHPYPRYPDNLESAKLKALECLEEAEEAVERYRSASL